MKSLLKNTKKDKNTYQFKLVDKRNIARRHFNEFVDDTCILSNQQHSNETDTRTVPSAS